jgi:uncharacterized protein
MSAERNIKTIQVLYEAFGRGDVDTVLESVTDDVDWASDTGSTAAPWYGVRQGKEAVASFFEQFGSTMEVEDFTPVTFSANDDSVLTVVHCRAKARPTGKYIDMNLHHYFKFRGDKVSYYRGSEDTVQTEAALQP